MRRTITESATYASGVTELEALVLRPLRAADEDEFTEAQGVMAREGFAFGLEHDEGMPFNSYLHRLDEHQRGLGLPPGWVPSTFLVAVADGVIVGRTSVRHRLNARLEEVGGHIGFCVLPDFRRNGYATLILRASLSVAAGLGISRALLTCSEANVASARVIEGCSGSLDSVAHGTRRYWIATAAAK